MNPYSLGSDEAKTYVKPSIDVIELALEGTFLSTSSASATGEDVNNVEGEF